MTRWPPFSRQRNKASGQSQCLQWRTLRGRYNGGVPTNSNRRATMCNNIAQFIRDLLDFAGLSSNLAYITSVFIGHIGTDSWIGSLIKRFATKSRSSEDAEINNQRKAFLDTLAWSEGTDNGRQKTRNHGYDVIVGGELSLDYSDHPRKLVTLNPKLKSTGADARLSRWWDAHRKQRLARKTSLRKVRTLWHCSRLRSVALYL